MNAEVISSIIFSTIKSYLALYKWIIAGVFLEIYARVTGTICGCLQPLQKDTWCVAQSKVSSFCPPACVSSWSHSLWQEFHTVCFWVFQGSRCSCVLMMVVLFAYLFNDATLFTEFLHLNPGQV